MKVSLITGVAKRLYPLVLSRSDFKIGGRIENEFIVDRCRSGSSRTRDCRNHITCCNVGILVWIHVLFNDSPAEKEQKKKAALINSVEVGDSILTTSGFYGIVIDVTDEDVIVEFGNNKNCRIPMKKGAIEQVEKPESE